MLFRSWKKALASGLPKDWRNGDSRSVWASPGRWQHARLALKSLTTWAAYSGVARSSAREASEYGGFKKWPCLWRSPASTAKTSRRKTAASCSRPVGYMRYACCIIVRSAHTSGFASHADLPSNDINVLLSVRASVCRGPALCHKREGTRYSVRFTLAFARRSGSPANALSKNPSANKGANETIHRKMNYRSPRRFS